MVVFSRRTSAQDKALLAAEKAIDAKTVENFLRLRNRLTSSEALLGGHVAFSSFFSSLEKDTAYDGPFYHAPSLARRRRRVKMEGTGVAKSF